MDSMVREAWTREYPDDEILGVRFDHAEWKRTAEMVRDGSAWSWHDMQYLGVALVVKTSGRIATIYPAFVNKNNLTGALTVGVDTKSAEYVVEQMLLSNWK